MNMTLVRHLVRRTLRGKRLIGTSLLASVGGIAAWISMTGQAIDVAVSTYQNVISTVPAATLSIALLIVTSATLRDERDGGTLPYIYMSPVPAWNFSSSAAIAALISALWVAVVGWVPGWLGAGVITGDWNLALPALGLYLIAAAGYTALFLALGYLFDRSLIIGLAYIFVWEGIIATAVPGLASSSVWRIAMSSYADLETLPRDALDVLGSVTPGVGGATVTVTVLVGLSTALLTWAVRFRDAV